MLYNAFKMLCNAFASGFFFHKNAKVFELFITKTKFLIGPALILEVEIKLKQFAAFTYRALYPL